MTSCINAGEDANHLKRPTHRPNGRPYGGPRSPRCYTCWLEERRRVKRARQAAYTERTYSLTEVESDAIWEAQGRRCAICGRPVKVRAAANDHDHRCCPGPTSCGKCIRGKLCKPCNSMLAHARDNVEVFLRAARYLLAPPAPEILRRIREDQGQTPAAPE